MFPPHAGGPHEPVPILPDSTQTILVHNQELLPVSCKVPRFQVLNTGIRIPEIGKV